METASTEPAGRKGEARVPLALARGSMVLARPILDRDGRVAVGSGTALAPRVVQVLRRLAIQSVTVVATEDIAPWERAPDPAEAKAAIEARFAREPDSEPMQVLRAAVVRRSLRRAAGSAERAGPDGGEA